MGKNITPIATNRKEGMMDIYKFDCNGNNAPAYSCDKPGDNSGYYVRFDSLKRAIQDINEWVDEKEAVIQKKAG